LSWILNHWTLLSSRWKWKINNFNNDSYKKEQNARAIEWVTQPLFNLHFVVDCCLQCGQNMFIGTFPTLKFWFTIIIATNKVKIKIHMRRNEEVILLCCAACIGTGIDDCWKCWFICWDIMAGVKSPSIGGADGAFLKISL
jgi:hypothetical protein